MAALIEVLVDSRDHDAFPTVKLHGGGDALKGIYRRNAPIFLDFPIRRAGTVTAGCIRKAAGLF
jgi:hypothetical protein